MRILFPVAFALAAFAAPAAAGPYEEGLQLGERQDYRGAMAAFRRAAEGGNAAAMRHVGFLHYDGKGVAQDTQQAVAWFARAGEAGDLKAQSDLAFMYETGTSVAPDPAKSAYWARKAAEGGDRSSQFRLGIFYVLGQGVEKDRIEGVKWMRIAFRHDDAWTRGARRNAEIAEEKMTAEQVAEAHRRAAEWMRQHPR